MHVSKDLMWWVEEEIFWEVNRALFSWDHVNGNCLFRRLLIKTLNNVIQLEYLLVTTDLVNFWSFVPAKAQIVIGCEDVERKIKHKKGLTRWGSSLSWLFLSMSGGLFIWKIDPMTLLHCTCESSCYLALSTVSWSHSQSSSNYVMSTVNVQWIRPFTFSCGGREAPMICGRELPGSGSSICRVALSSLLCFYQLVPALERERKVRVCPSY
jgi:hypothetical protein